MDMRKWNRNYQIVFLYVLGIIQLSSMSFSTSSGKYCPIFGLFQILYILQGIFIANQSFFGENLAVTDAILVYFFQKRPRRTGTDEKKIK